MRLVVATVKCEPHSEITSSEIEDSFWVSASIGDRLEHVHATHSESAWYICMYSKNQDAESVRTDADQLVRRALASIATINRWKVLSVELTL